jgi:chaperonin cofactor prefoldin
MNRENAFCVERSQDVPAMDCSEELLGQELARIEAHQSYARVRYRMLKSKFAMPFRRVIADAATAELGTRMEAERSRVAAARSQEQRQQGKVRKLSRGLNMAVSDRAARRPETAPALERLTELMNEVEEETT